jgi:tetratricopeptide (TPR) repeat protein
MRPLTRAAAIAILLLAAIPAGAELANADRSGLQVKSFAQVLRLPDSQIDIGTAALLLSEYGGKEIDIRRYRQMLDEMAITIQRRLEEKHLKPDYRAIAVVNKYLFDELGYKAVNSAEDPRNLFLDEVLTGKKGYCLSLSILYLSIGERIGMPLYGVVVPGHFFVRYDDGARQFDIETTSGGSIPDDEYYVRTFKVPSSGRDSIYMRNLTSRETLSCFLNNLSNVRQKAGGTDAAIADLETAVGISPGLSAVHSNLGNSYAKKGWRDKALYEYNRAIQLNPGESKAFHNRAGIYLAMGQTWDAIRDYDRAIAMEPNMIESYRGIADAYRQEKYYGEALVMLNKGRLMAPSNTDLVIQMGDVYRESGDTAEAIATYQKALRAKPNDIHALFGLGLVYGQKGSIDKEIEAYKRTVMAKFTPEEKEYKRLAFFNMGNAYMNKKLYDTALASYQVALVMKPNDPETLYNLGVASMYRKDYKAAAGWFDKALAVEPDNKDAHNSLAFALYYLKQYGPAWEHIQKAKALGADVADDLYKFLANKAGQPENER